jgi:hypothetical protein
MHYDYEVFREALAARIKALREAKGWTQMHITTDFGYHASFYLSGKALKRAGKCRSKPYCASPTLSTLRSRSCCRVSSAVKDPASAPTATIGNTPQKTTKVLVYGIEARD